MPGSPSRYVQLSTTSFDEMTGSDANSVEVSGLNVERPARAGRLLVLLSEHDSTVLCRGPGNGQGLDATHVTTTPCHVGLASIQERARFAHGWCRMESAPGAGTQVEFWSPSEVYATRQR